MQHIFMLDNSNNEIYFTLHKQIMIINTSSSVIQNKKAHLKSLSSHTPFPSLSHLWINIHLICLLNNEYKNRIWDWMN